ncbi:Putative fluoride ion transporter CrcB [Calycomorphotria hydatis]|uniref:Fluoride-specific ion channel FluC n=1 Tax=Calycomorphotria hydatis TaxID=2528027 RepID=A0A517T8V9_9PLAN|nr:Putative fluoride ion transporter CrcB [Calycomorphotria hydatis]
MVRQYKFLQKAFVVVTLPPVIAVAVGGALGAVTRYGVSLWVTKRFPEYAPLGTLIVNVAGCLLIGVLGTLVARDNLSPSLKLFLVTGCLGSLTTFSTFGYETLEYALERQRWDYAAANVALNLLIGLAAVWIGRQCVLAASGS